MSTVAQTVLTQKPATVRLDIEHKRGDTFDEIYELTNEETGDPINFGSGATARMVFRNHSGEVAPLLTWSTATGEIDLGDPTLGVITFDGPTDEISWECAYYDIEVTHGGTGKIKTYLSGLFSLTAEIAQ